MSSKFDWSQIKSALVEFAENLPVEFSSCVLIGGGAALAYRAALQSFNLAHLISANAKTKMIGWVSRNADFVSTEVGANEIAVVKPGWVKMSESGQSHIEAQGIRLSFVQAPLTFTPDEALSSAHYIDLVSENKRYQCAIVNPVLLYREKQNMVEKGRGKANDRPHMGVARIYAAFYLGHLLREFAKNLDPAARRKFLDQAILTKDRAPEILTESLWTSSKSEVVQNTPQLASLLTSTAI